MKFRSLKGIEKGCIPIFAKDLRKMIKKFEETGSFEVESGRKWKSVASTSAEDVVTPLQEEKSSGEQTFSA